jgi:hypothetical protein
MIFKITKVRIRKSVFSNKPKKNWEGMLFVFRDIVIKFVFTDLRYVPWQYLTTVPGSLDQKRGKKMQPFT